MPNFRESIDAVNAAFMTAFAEGDASEVAKTYADDGQALPPNGDVVTGHAALKEMWQGVMSLGIKEATVESVEVEQLGNHAYEVGKYTMVAANNLVFDKGKYVIVWKRLPSGEWRWYRDIWNSSMPPASA